MRPAEDAGDVALRLLVAPVVFLGALLVAVDGVRHGGVYLGVGLGGSLLRALLLLRLLWWGGGYGCCSYWGCCW